MGQENQTDVTIEEEMGLAGAAAEDAEAEYIRRITETEVVTGTVAPCCSGESETDCNILCRILKYFIWLEVIF